MSELDDDTPQQENEKPAGFIERRWRMAKAGAKKMFSYLFDIKTYVYAGVLFGGAALLGTTGTGFGEGIAKMFGVTDGASGVLTGMGRAVILGTLINAGIAMVKESNDCNGCKEPASQTMSHRVAKASPERGASQEQNYGQYEIDHGYSPSPLPPTTAQHGTKPPQIGM